MNDRFDALAALVCPKGKPKAEDAKPKAEDDGDDDDDNEEQEADKGTVLSTAVTTIEKLREENTQLRADNEHLRKICQTQTTKGTAELANNCPSELAVDGFLSTLGVVNDDTTQMGDAPSLAPVA